MATEEELVRAHKAGLREAAKDFAALAQKAMDLFSTQEERFSFMSGYIQELKRITRKDRWWCNLDRHKHLSWDYDDVEHDQ